MLENRASQSSAAPDAAQAREIQEAVKHIKSLSKLAKSIPSILNAVGCALEALSDDHLAADEQPGRARTIEDRKKAYQEHTNTYFSLVKNVSRTLQAEVIALEEAKILPRELSTADRGVTNNGIGNFDIGVLNSRAEDSVLHKRQELLAAARELLAKQAASQAAAEPGPAAARQEGAAEADFWIADSGAEPAR